MHACSDLEENLIDEVQEDVVVVTVDNDPIYIVDYISPAYSELRNTGTANHGGYYTVQEVSSDEMVICAKGADWSNDPAYLDLHRHTYDPHNLYLNLTWTSLYNAINTTNRQLEDYPQGGSFDAQTRALRAYFYFRLLDLFGNVKIITIPGEDAPQASRQEVFDFVESELLAVLKVDEVSSTMDLSDSALGTEFNPYIFNQYGVLGLLAKLYLNAEVYTGSPRWQEAADAASYIIDSGVYQLCGEGCKVRNLGRRNGVDTDPLHLEGYAAVFAPNNEDNREHIFSVFYDELSATGMNFSQMNLHYGNQLSYNFDSQPWNGYATLEEFYNSFEDEDVRKKANFLVGEQFDFGGSAVLDYATDDGNVVLNYTPRINELWPNSHREAGARPAKFSFKQFGKNDMDNDYPIVRLGEMYLVRAEAMARLANDWNMAVPDVNILRARAKIEGYTALDEEEFLAERGREMFQESVRRTDLIRFRKYNNAWWEKPTDPSDHVNVFPIPFAQIQASNGTLTQNPGY
jgi:hypothetical protein